MVNLVYEIKVSKTTELINFKSFIENHNPSPTFSETIKNGLTVFKLNFNNDSERNDFYNDFRKTLGYSS
tara:strand:- start:5558 stop:5764 length:207 start_codon:yes stop_codon:yes gene_type:complete